ncbi:MAG TPA: metallophosphoesterase [Schlesneria sp.]
MAVFFLFVVFVLAAGFAKSMAIWINWVCSLRIAKKLVIADKGLNLLLIGSYPLVLIYGLGWQGPQYLRGGRATSIDSLWWVPIGLGVFGFVALVHAAIRFHCYRPPACEIEATSRLIDLRKTDSWRERFVGTGGMSRRLAVLPLNQQFAIEVSTKTYRLPRLPAAWDGLSIVHLSDLHFYCGVAKDYFKQVCEQAALLHPDIYIFSGDLIDDPRRLDWLPETLGQLRAPLGQYYVLGNHDWYLNPAATRSAMASLGWVDLIPEFKLINSSTEPSAAPLLFCGDETPWMGTHADLANAPPGAFRVLVSHTPDNIEWARKNQIDLMLSGHTHGGQVRLPLLGPVYSPSRYGCRYASGVFWRDPTLLCVSRGISGKEPLRYNCPPEVTKLILRSAEAKTA